MKSKKKSASPDGTIVRMSDLKNPLEKRVNPRMFDSEPLRRCSLEECTGACCVFGVWVDPREVEDILNHSSLIMPFMTESTRNPGEWFAPVEDVDKHSPSGKVIHTAVEPAPWHYGETACIFCQQDGKCALQLAAVANNLHPWRFKPFYCILHPIDLDDQGRFTLDETHELLNEPGSCLRKADHPIPIMETFEPELKYFLGEKGFQAMQQEAHSRNNKNTIQVFPITSTDREWVRKICLQEWMDEIVVVHDQVFHPDQLDGFKAIINGQPVGLICYQFNAKDCEIILLNSFNPGLGVGSALIQAVEEAAMNKSLETCFLVTTNDNQNAIRFYQNAGYIVKEVRQDAVTRARLIKPSIPLTNEDGVPITDEILMEKKLK